MAEKRTRKYYNELILENLRKYLDSNPDLRFHQALQNLSINARQQGDRFHEESKETYENMFKV